MGIADRLDVRRLRSPFTTALAVHHLRRLRSSSTAGLALFYLVVLVVFSVLSADFRTESNLDDLLTGYSYVGIVAVGMAFPIILAGIDLSVGSIIGVSGMVVFDLSVLTSTPGPLIIVAALVVGTAVGALNGLLIARLRLSPFIVTLAAMAAWRGVTYAISGRSSGGENSVLSITNPTILNLDGYYGQLPRSFVYLVVLAAAAGWLLTRTRYGRDLYSVGGNERAAFLAGINVTRTKVIAYAISGFASSVAALILAARLTTSPEDGGTGIELSAIAAAVVGGVSLAGGIGGALGPVIGAFLIGTLYVGLQLEGVSEYSQQVVAGSILIGAVAYDRIGQLRRARKASEERERLRPMGDRSAAVSGASA